MGIKIHSDFALSLDPGHKAYQDTYDEGIINSTPVSPVLFNMKGSLKADETIVAMSDIGEPGLRGASLPPTTEGEIKEMWKKTLTHAEWAIYAKLDEGLWEDLPADRRAAYPRGMANSMMSKAEALAAAVFSGGFATLGGDGKAIFATDHPLEVAGTWSNKGTAALSLASLSAARATMRTQLSPQGRVTQSALGRYLVVPPALEKVASEITGAKMYGVANAAGGTDFNDASFGSIMGLTYLTWEYLTGSVDDWFVSANPGDVARGFDFYWRVAPTYRGGADEENMRYWCNSRMRCSVAAVDGHQAFGSDV
jgi:hypothetical protein